MSYDVWLVREPCPCCKRPYTGLGDFNLTHNVNRIVDACLSAYGDIQAQSGDGTTYEMHSWGRLDGWTAKDAVPVLERALVEAKNPARLREFRAMEPDNGWGKLEDAQRTLSEFLDACRENPDAKIRASG